MSGLGAADHSQIPLLLACRRLVDGDVDIVQSNAMLR
jgi:hypothetical protein